MYKLLVLAAVLAVANGGLTTTYHVANPVVHTPVVYSAAHHTVPLTTTYNAHHTPVVYTSGVHHTVPVVHHTAAKVVTSYKPVEQHGYQITY